MPDSPDYKIKKLEKGPLQRFKNQNLLIKKFGEVGLQIYKAITGKRTSKELKRDLGIEAELFDQIIAFMHDAGMVDLEPVVGSKEIPKEVKEIEIEEPEIEEKKEPSRKLEDIPPEEQIEIEPDTPPLEEQPKPSTKAKKKPVEETTTINEIQPITIDEFTEPEKDEKQEKKDEEDSGEIEPIEETGQPQEETEDQSTSETGESTEEKNEDEQNDITISAFEENNTQSSSQPALSPVEKIISDKYGDVGLRVYALIDGQRTAEEIMRETGLTEPKLVEILDFMDEQGIIKLDYPKGSSSSSSQSKSPFTGSTSTQQTKTQIQQTKSDSSQGFKPIFDINPDEAQSISSPVEIPIKAPLDIIKSVQTKAKILLKYGESGTKILEKLDGKTDVIDIALQLDIPLYEVSDILRFMLENGMLIIKPVSRADVRKKYGDDGYSVYKVYGKEGLMLYELIGKELTIKQMAEKITKDKAKIIDMFIFIHKVLGIELPIDKEVLTKQLDV